MQPTKQDIEAQVKQALEQEYIRNVDYQNLKDWANRMIDEAFKKEVSDKCYEQAGNDEELRRDATIISSEFGVMGLYEVPSRLKKLDAWKVKPAKRLKDWGKPFPANFMPLVVAFFENWKQLASDVAAIKPFIVKGRIKSDNPKPEPKNPTATCQICQQEYCVMPGSGVIYLHGYQRPGWGYVIGNCDGAQYPPYEQSCDRAKEVKATFEEMVRCRKSFLEHFHEVTSLTWKKHETIYPGHPDWNKAFDSHKTLLELELSSWEREVKRLERIIQSWKPAS
jgi:hypothetical protein